MRRVDGKKVCPECLGALVDQVDYWAERCGVSKIQVPALTVLMVGTDPLTEKDLERGRQLIAEGKIVAPREPEEKDLGLTHLLRELIPRNMADAIDAEGGTEFIADMVRRYLEADEVSRADIRAFFDSDGPAGVKDAHERLAAPRHAT